MYRFFKGVRKLIFSFSYFQASQYFRFRKGDSYVHNSAGFLSLALQIIITISLVYQLVYIFQGNSAFSTNRSTYNYPPPASTIGRSNNFMAAIQVMGSVPGLQVNFYQNDETTSSKNQNFLGAGQSCTFQHWSGLTSFTVDDFNNRSMNSWLCMPKDAEATLKGAKNTNVNSYLSIDISCPTCSLPSLTTIQLQLHFKNALINPTDGHNYISYYINSDNSISMSNSNSLDSTSILLQDYMVESDTTILPWYSFIYESGVIATSTKNERFTQSSSSYRSQVLFRKTSKSTTYTRNLMKILDAFYFMVGSFAPTILSFAFFIYPILASIFEMRFAKYVYRLEEGKSFGLMGYIKENFYLTFKKICHLNSERWQRWEKISQVRQVLSKVMQVQYLYQRIDFLERAIKFLFKDHHLCGLRLMKKDSIIEAEQKYKKYEIRKAIKNYVISQQRKQLQQLKIDTSKSILIKSQRQNHQSDQNLPKKLQSQMINPKKYTFDSKKQIKKFQSTKQFQINELDYEGEKMRERIDQNKQFYVKLVEDFKKLKRQAQSYDSQDYIGKLIYDQLKQNDIDLMEEFEKMIKGGQKQRKSEKKSPLPQIIKNKNEISQNKSKPKQQEQAQSPMRSQSMFHSTQLLHAFQDNFKKRS